MRPRAWWTNRWHTSMRFQDVMTSAIVFVLGLTLNLLRLTQTYPDARLPAFADASPWWHTVLLAVGCAAMLFKRRHPLGALSIGLGAVAVDAMLGGSVAMVLVLFDLLFSVGLFATARGRTAVMTGVVVLIGTASVVAGLAVGDLRSSVFIALQLTGLLVVPLWWGANLRQQRELGRINEERARHEAIDAERSSMARELHDVIAAHLSTTAIHSAAALAQPSDPQRDRAALRAVRESSLAALADMRSMISLLRADDNGSVVAAGLERLPDLVAAARSTGLEVTLDSAEPVHATALTSQAGYRIVSEALTNARKHSPGAAIHVRVAADAECLEITVTNTLTQPVSLGHGALSSGTGLTVMAERAGLLGGTVSAGPQDGRWVVRAVFPTSPKLSGMDK